jgi:ribosomal protein L37AE/L43A
MILDVNGQPYKEQEVPAKGRTPCNKCGSVQSRNIVRGFSKTWRLICQQCGYEVAIGRGELPEGEI